MSLEKRTLTRPLEMRADGADRKVGGYAVVYNSPTVIGDDFFTEVFLPGAFTEAVREDVVALFGHDRNRVLGRTTSKTLVLREDNVGVAFEVVLPDTTDGRDLAVSVERGDIRGNSFGFIAVKETWDETVTPPQRSIHKASLIEISPTAFPAYDDTTIAMRSLEETRKEQRRSNFSAAAKRLRMKTDLDLKVRSKA
jgi:HK97 family phage prohead protease